ncbi:unnamed protein product [Prunus armeniaca]|uniref:Uncharacterized protein n=1 Tax=Prunus armeniaca TaxID=36596 RepID=A0A6J5VBU8_PRUAR|nr:unnamed protein product [Prunus armeniaca]
MQRDDPKERKSETRGKRTGGKKRRGWGRKRQPGDLGKRGIAGGGGTPKGGCPGRRREEKERQRQILKGRKFTPRTQGSKPKAGVGGGVAGKRQDCPHGTVRNMNLGGAKTLNCGSRGGRYRRQPPKCTTQGRAHWRINDQTMPRPYREGVERSVEPSLQDRVAEWISIM